MALMMTTIVQARNTGQLCLVFHNKQKYTKMPQRCQFWTDFGHHSAVVYTERHLVFRASRGTHTEIGIRAVVIKSWRKNEK